MTTVAPNATLKQRLEAKTVSTPSGCIEYAWYIQEHLLRQFGVELDDVDLHHKH